MKFFGVLFCFYWWCFSGISQNYQSIQANNISFFSGFYNEIFPIRVDSVKKINNDSVFYFFKNIQHTENYDCSYVDGDSWLGKKVIIQPSGMNIFFNKKMDTIKIKTNAILDEEWTFFNLPDSISIIAKITNHDTLSFLGQFDSVKTISFTVLDNNLDTVPHDINQLTIQLSKNFGFLKPLNFYRLYCCNAEYYENQLFSLLLTGMTNPTIGIQNLTWLDVFDFEVGDELHIVYRTYGMNEYNYLIKTIFRYLEKTTSGSSVSYKYEKIQGKTTYEYGVNFSQTYEFTHDTSTSSYSPYETFDRLPKDPIVSEYAAYEINMYNNTKVILNEVHWLRPNSFVDSCWFGCCGSGCPDVYAYTKGLGGPYYSCQDFSIFGGVERDLVYYKKGSKVSGNPLIITDVQDKNISSEIIIFPNPANNYIYWVTNLSR
jgi:hypothetical protein